MGKKRSEMSGAYHEHMATALSPSERAAQNKKANNERSHLTSADGFVPASEIDGLSPEDRATSRGADFRQGLPSMRKLHGYVDADRKVIQKDLAKKGAATHKAGADQSAARADYQTIYGERHGDPTEVRSSGPAHKRGLELKSTVKGK